MKKYLTLSVMIFLLSCNNISPIVKINNSNNYDVILRTNKDNTKFKAISIPFNILLQNNSSKKRKLSYNKYISYNLPSNKVFRVLYSKVNNKLNRERNNSSIILEPKSTKKFIYYVTYIVDDSTKFPSSYFNFLKQENKKDSILVGNFKEFKIKNSKLLEGLLKNDSISFDFESTDKINKYDVIRVPVKW